MIPAGENPTLELIRKGAEVADCLPDAMSNVELNAAIHGLVGRVVDVEISRVEYRYMLGTAMAMAMARRDFLPEMGYKNFADYQKHLQATVKASHGNLWTWKPIVEKLPPLSRQQLEIPANRLYFICQHVQDRAKPEMLDIAAEAENLDEVVRYAEDRGYLSAPMEGKSDYLLSGSKEDVKEAKRFLEHPDILEHTGATNSLQVVLMLIADTQGGAGISDWPKI